MAIITKPKTFSYPNVILSADVNSNFDTIYNDYNGGITNANIHPSAGIKGTQLATITAAGKVNISALTATSQATGDLMYASNASAYTRLPIGTTLQKLRTNAAATAPEWYTEDASTALVGSVVQTVYASTSANTTGTTPLPLDTSIPLITEGNEYLTCTITPKALTNKLKIDVSMTIKGASTDIGAALFNTDVNATDAIRTGYGVASGAGNPAAINFTHYMNVPIATATVFKLRAGTTGAGTNTLNPFFAGAGITSITIQEIKV